MLGFMAVSMQTHQKQHFKLPWPQGDLNGIFISLAQQSWRGYTGFTLSVRLSLVRLSVDKIVSALYLLQYSPDPFHINTSYQATSEGVLHVFFKIKKIWSFGKFFKSVTWTLSCFVLGYMSWSVVWVIMARWGYPQNTGILVVLVDK